MSISKRTFPYLGITHGGRREIFMASAGPLHELKGSLYARVVGPFRTMREANMQRTLPAGTFARDGVIACVECSHALNCAGPAVQVLTIGMPADLRLGAYCPRGHVRIEGATS